MNRGQILRELILEQINALIDGGVIVANDKLRYDADKNYDNPLDIPSLGYIQALIEQGGTTDIRRVFIIPSSEIDDNGEVNLTGRTNEQGDTIIPSDAVVSIYNPRWGGQQYDPSTGVVSGLDPSFDVLVVLNGVEPVAPTTIGLKNDSGVDMIYSINNGQTQSFLVNQIIQITPGDSLILATTTAPTDALSLKNQNGYLQNTDGGYDIEQTPHQWNIPINSNTLIIESGLG